MQASAGAAARSMARRPDGRRAHGLVRVLIAATATVAAASALAAAPRLDLSGRAQLGKASYYAMRFAGRPMADGTPMNPQRDNAASRTLPLGTRAVVTNLATGRSAVVTIQDRGPYVQGRIVDLSPATARRIGITPEVGVARVEVAPLEVPLPDGRLRPGVASTADAGGPHS